MQSDDTQGRVALPSELQGLLDQVAAAEGEARTLVAGLTDAQANWQPDGGRAWSVAQCLDHLGRIQRFYTDAVLPIVRDAAARPSGVCSGLAPGFLGRKFVQSQEPPPTRRMTAPKQIVPGSSIPVAQALEGFVASHAGYRELVGLATSVDTNHVIVRNPFLPIIRMKLSTVLLVLPAHDRRHLWQARQVMAAPGFPRG